MTDLEKVEELTKALQEGKTLVNKMGSKARIINGIIFECINDQRIINAFLDLDEDWQIEEPFTITENKLCPKDLVRKIREL